MNESESCGSCTRMSLCPSQGGGDSSESRKRKAEAAKSSPAKAKAGSGIKLSLGKQASAAPQSLGGANEKEKDKCESSSSGGKSGAVKTEDARLECIDNDGADDGGVLLPDGALAPYRRCFTSAVPHRSSGRL